MPKSPPPVAHRRDCRFDQLVAAALERGFGVTLVYRGIPDLERGHEIRRGIYRCAKHRDVSAEAGPSRVVDDPAEMGLHATGDTFELRYRLWKKSGGRAHVLAKHGQDRAAWPYDPRRGKTQEDVDYWKTLGLNEKGHRVS